MSSSTIVVAVVTYCRPGAVAELLSEVLQQCAALDRAVVLIVDNDPTGSAKPTVQTVADTAGDGAAGRESPAVQYVREDQPGIAAARNRALAEATLCGADLLVFIDDDERPEPQWLEHLLATYYRSRPAAVAGPVVSTFRGEVHPWIRDGAFFERKRFATGTPVPAAASNNLLLDLHQVSAFGLRFDVRFGLTGGSDTLFTRQLVRSGGAILWCDEAVVTDVVLADRLTLAWGVRKLFRIGNTDSRVAIALSGGGIGRFSARARSVARGSGRVIVGASRLVVGAVLRRPVLRAGGLRLSARGAGLAAGAVGIIFSEYRRPATAVRATSTTPPRTAPTS
ncbi:glycosyltransferase involved in cell wall biosynthesis [Nakamurella sp. UYEF19]|uniref:glycosyltransferase family 2 protein n=1 Tax=Nakamurella sp. UYEF19 TaxID=1756392 RepID=UPI003392C9E0